MSSIRHPLFYRPSDGFVGDVIPFYWEGHYHAFYLKAPLPPQRTRPDGNRTPWAHLVSQDLVHWDEWPLAIAPGEPGEPDHCGCWTGSVIEKAGVFYLFYTGCADRNLPQAVCVATSRDLRTWQKDERNPILKADPRWYELLDWRDPFVFWNEEQSEYWMLLAARENHGPSSRRGCIGLTMSSDLEHWEVRPPFWAPKLHWIPFECPDLFRWGNQWVLVYSESSDRTVTHYRTSASLAGPWHAPDNDTFDGRAFYAAKTASDGARRFAFGWIPTREGETDSGRWEWAGSLAIHELHRHQDTSIQSRAVPEVKAQFSDRQSLAFEPCLGAWQHNGATFTALHTDGFAAALVGDMPDRCHIELTITCSADTRACGVLLRADAALENYYQLRWEPGQKRIVFDHWPRPGYDRWPRPVDEPYILACPLQTLPGQPLRLTILVEGTIMVAYADQAVAISCRAYEHQVGQLGLFVTEGEAGFADVTLRR